MPTLQTPSEDDYLWTDHPLFSRFRVGRGLSLCVQGDTVTARQYIAQEDWDNYDQVYLGGHTYEITDAEAAVLSAAGFGSYIT